MTTDEMIESVQFAREWAEAQVAEAKDHGALLSVFELDKVLTALRAAPPAPAPELVALVQRVRVANRNKHAAAVWDTVAQAIAERRLDDELDALLAWAPAAPVEPPARPEMCCMAPAPTSDGRTCDKPSGHDGEHWTYGGAGLRWPPARPEAAAPTPQPDEDDGKIARDHAPRYSQVDLDMATKPLHTEIERLRAAPTPAPTVDTGWDAETVKRQVADFNTLVDTIHGLRAEIQSLRSAAPTPAPGSPLPLEHGRSCAVLVDGDCTCGLSWRVRLVTEQEMHAAWRKRADEAESRLAALSSPVGETPKPEHRACHHCGWIATTPLCSKCGRERDSGILPLDSPRRQAPVGETPAPKCAACEQGQHHHCFGGACACIHSSGETPADRKEPTS